MRFDDALGGAWLLATAGGALAVAIVFAWVLLQRRRRSGKLELSSEALAPEPDARATGRALHARDLISCIAGVWLFISPRILGSPDIAVSWLGHDLPPSSMLPGEPQGWLTAGARVGLPSLLPNRHTPLER